MGLLRGVIDPELGSDIVELGMARSADVDDDGVVLLEIALTTAGCPLRAQIQKDIRSRLETLPGVTKVSMESIADELLDAVYYYDRSLEGITDNPELKEAQDSISGKVKEMGEAAEWQKGELKDDKKHGTGRHGLSHQCRG